MTITLPPDLEELVKKKVQSGQYHSASEVVLRSLRLLQEQDATELLRIEDLKREIARGVEQAVSGEIVSGEEVFTNLRERNAKMAIGK